MIDERKTCRLNRSPCGRIVVRRMNLDQRHQLFTQFATRFDQERLCQALSAIGLRDKQVREPDGALLPLSQVQVESNHSELGQRCAIAFGHELELERIQSSKPGEPPPARLTRLPQDLEFIAATILNEPKVHRIASRLQVAPIDAVPRVRRERQRLEERGRVRVGLEKPRWLTAPVHADKEGIESGGPAGINRLGAPLTEVGAGPLDELSPQAAPAMQRVNEHGTDDARGIIERGFLGIDAKARVNAAHQAILVERQDQAVRIEVGLRKIQQLQRIAREPLGGSRSQTGGVPQLDDPWRIGIVEWPKLDQDTHSLPTALIPANNLAPPRYATRLTRSPQPARFSRCRTVHPTARVKRSRMGWESGTSRLHMPESKFTDEELWGYLDESLSVEALSEIEAALRASAPLRTRLAELARARDQGSHSVGAIWRRRRVSCPTRSELGSFLLGTLSAQEADYLRFHIETVGCRYCAANLDDLKSASARPPAEVARRRRYFESSAGYLHPDEQSEPLNGD